MDNIIETSAVGNNTNPTKTTETGERNFEKNWSERNDVPEDHTDAWDFADDPLLKNREWSFIHDDRRPGDVYLLLATVADSSGVTSKRLLVGTWNDYTNTWKYQEGFAGSVIQVLAWLWLLDVSEEAFHDLEGMWDALRKKQLDYGVFDRTDSPEDHNDAVQ